MPSHRRWLLAIALLHAALFLWAAWAWNEGPFEGQGVVDGAEMLELARQGSAGPFQTKSPLYPWLLGRLLGLGAQTGWTVALFGLCSSLGLLAAVAGLARQLGGARAGAAAALLYACSGSALAFGVQPLETLFAAALLAGGACLAEIPGPRGRRFLGGVLLLAAPFARIELLLPAALLALRAAARRSPAALGAGAALLVLGLAFGPRAIPEGGTLNLRLGNDPARSGAADLRVGPRYDRLRLEAVFSQPAQEPLRPAAQQQLRLLAGAIAQDPAGLLANLARKAYLFVQRTEIAASADFRHGLQRFPPAPILLASFALVLPLALVGLVRRRPPVLVWPLLAIALANVLLVAAARYRFPALPFLCVAAGLALTRRPTRSELSVGIAAALLCIPNLAGVRLVTSGDGLVQEGYLRLAAPGRLAEARVALERAVELGQDPRARYLLALALEREARALGPADGRAADLLDQADRWYAAALALEPAYPEAAENRVALALRRGDAQRARELAHALSAVPYAGQVFLNLAQTLPAGAERRAAELRGHESMALRSAAQGSPNAALHAREARRLGSVDARVLGLAAP